MSLRNVSITKLSAFFHSVRFRLALWFTFVLGVILLFFSAFVYVRIAQDMYRQTATRLALRLSDIDARLKGLEGSFLSSDRWTPDARQLDPFTLQDKEVVILSDPEGKLTETWGPVNPGESTAITQRVVDQAFSPVPTQNGNLLFTYPLAQMGPNEKQPANYLFAPAPVLYKDRLWGWIIIGRPVDPEEQLPRLFWTLFLAGLLTLLIAMAGSYWLADRALWPVKAITRTAREISETDLNRRLNIKSRDELGELAGTFDRMLDRLQAAFNRQRQFTADASHELRTPLTIIGLEAGRALEGKRSLEEYRSALEIIQSENSFMSRLVSELLILARMDAGQITLERQPLDLSDVALEVVERFESLAANREIQLSIGDLPELPILGDRQYLAQMIGNLVDNAIKYSPEHSSGQWVRVETGSEMADSSGTVWVRVTDNGLGISPEHLPHLFDRFYRIDRARSHNPEESTLLSDIPGSGLGLSIVQWIAQMHGGRVTVESKPGQGSVFEVQLPGLQPAGA